jgi:hypothetical protein
MTPQQPPSEEDHTYPGYFDITFGQNAAVSGASLRGIMWRPAWFLPLNRDWGLSFFGEAFIQFREGTTTSPLILQAAPNVALSADTVYISSRPTDRDYYHIGIGFEFMRLYRFILANRQQAGN